MSQQTYVAWYTNSASIDPVDILQRVPPILGLEQAESVSRSFRFVEGPDDDDFEEEEMGRNVPARRLPKLYKAGTVLFVMDDAARAGKRVRSAIAEGLGNDIVGDHPPCRAILDVGGYYFVDDADMDENVIRYTAQVAFWNYSTPHDYERMRRSVFLLPELKQLKVELESVMGPLHEAMYVSL